MVRTVLKYVAIAMVVLVAIAWLWSGGYRGIVNFVRTIANPIDIIWGTSTSTYEVALPWQVAIPQGADIELLMSEGAGYEQPRSPEERLEDLQAEYDALEEEAAKQARSPHYGKVSLSRAFATESHPSSEYVVISARNIPAGGVSTQGWSLASVVTGIRVMLPMAATEFRQGALTSIQPVVLRAGESMIVTSGFSPTGVSFRENRCIGYLANSLRLDPPLSSTCPAPSENLSLTDQNLQRYGGDCIDYVRSIPQCVQPASVPLSLPAACRIYIANTFSYNGCVDAQRSQPDFALDTWRLYIGSGSELWANNHDSIRLLDEYGRTIDAITY